MKKLVIVPTYNELENIKALLPVLMDLNSPFDVLVVDDSSPDGTADFVQMYLLTQPRVYLLKRKEKDGLGKAYIAGFKWALQNKYDAVVEMDADFSHSPTDLLKILQQLETSPVVIGSRYVPGGRTVNWGILRKLISRGGGIYSRLILGYQALWPVVLP